MHALCSPHPIKINTAVSPRKFPEVSCQSISIPPPPETTTALISIWSKYLTLYLSPQISNSSSPFLLSADDHVSYFTEKMKAAKRDLSYTHLFFPSTHTASASFLSVPGWTICVCVCVCVCVLVAQLSLTLCNPIDSCPPGSVHGILQARILEWVVISFSKGSS